MEIEPRIAFRSSPAEKSETSKEIHSLPCKMDYTGPASVQNYFRPQELEDGSTVAAFRGRLLNGYELDMPEGYQLFVSKEAETNDDKRIFDVVSAHKSINYWEFDRSKDWKPHLPKVFDYLKMAETLATFGELTVNEILLGGLRILRPIFKSNFRISPSNRVHGEPLSLIVGAGSAAAFSILTGLSYLAKCSYFECCAGNWISFDDSGLRNAMRKRFHGQHLADQTIVTALMAHLNNKSPKKALAMSFHGWTGCGKNYLSSIIAEHLYKLKMKSQYVHLFISTLHFSNSNDVPLYQAELRSWITGNVSNCERSLFIFDEVDKMPAQLMDAIKPFLDHYDNLDGVDFRKSIFIFLSNAGGNEITQKTLDYYQSGKSRNEITLKEMEDLVISNAYNAEGGMQKSNIISSHLIDHFVPFLPLERRHVLLCVRDYLLSRHITPTDEQIYAIADSLQYFPKSNPIYSSSGCKRVAQKAELLILSERRKALQLAEDQFDNI